MQFLYTNGLKITIFDKYVLNIAYAKQKVEVSISKFRLCCTETKIKQNQRFGTHSVSWTKLEASEQQIEENAHSRPLRFGLI